MKQGTLFFRILTVGVLVVILAYLGSSGLKSMQDTMLTTIAIEYEAGDTYLASGYIVRDEQVLLSDAPITIPTLSEGAKAGVGQVVANCYTETAFVATFCTASTDFFYRLQQGSPLS